MTNKEYYIDSETGELIEKEDTNELVAKEINPIITDDFLEKLEMMEALEQQIEMFKTEHREQIKEIFKKYGVKSFKNDYISITYVPETMQKRVDNQRLKDDGIYDKYLKFVPVKEQIRITKKGKND